MVSAMDKTEKNTSEPNSELRNAPRARVSFRIVCERIERTPLGGLAWNLSTKGICMYSSKIAARGEPVTLSFPDLPKSRRLKAKVVWYEAGHADLFLIGFHFLKLMPADVKFIERLMRPDAFQEMVAEQSAEIRDKV
jgi:hypothetical protein